jgi:hypothetical protein
MYQRRLYGRFNFFCLLFGGEMVYDGAIYYSQKATGALKLPG